MTKFLFAIIFFIPWHVSLSQSVPGVLHKLDQGGLNFNLDYYADFFAGSGGDTNSSTARAVQYIDLTATVTTSRLVPQWRGGTFVTSFHHTSQSSPTSRGEFQALSSIDDVPRSIVSELWLEQLVNGKLRVRAGKLDANRDFGYLENGIEFLNVTPSYSPTAFLLPTFSDTRWGGEMLFSSPRLWTNLAVFVSGPGTHILSETGVRWVASSYRGRASMGFWHDTAQQTTFSGVRRASASGIYLLAEQTVFCRERVSGQAKQSVNVFVQMGDAPQDLTFIHRNIATGVVVNGPFARRAQDSAGVALFLAQLTNEPAAGPVLTRETVTEFFYRVQLASNITLTPDVQIVRHPGGHLWSTAVVGARLKFSLNTHTE